MGEEEVSAFRYTTADVTRVWVVAVSEWVVVCLLWVDSVCSWCSGLDIYSIKWMI